MTTIAEQKADLRREMKPLRAEAAARDPDASERLGAAFNMKLFDRFGPEVGSYWAIGDEMDPDHLEARLRKSGARFSLPRLEDNGEMTFRRFSGDPKSLETAANGLRQPTDAAPLVDPTLLFVPLLAFDSAGGRLGYGKGYFDRYLNARRTAARERTGPRIFACGLAYAAQGVEAVPTEDHDERLDWVQTPSRSVPVFLMGALGGG